MCNEIFMEWFRTKLLPNSPENSVIIIDNASYHSVQKFKIPNTGSREIEIMEFWEKNYENYTKKGLLEVLKTKTFAKQYEADKEAPNWGHVVLRLPPYHCIFNPIEMIWAQLKGNLRRNNRNHKFSEQTIDLIKEVSKIDDTKWANGM
jgi:transposase